MAFYVGQEVICIDGYNSEFVAGNTYFIEKVYTGRYGDTLGVPCVWLIGIVDHEKPTFGGFRASRFRPLTSNHTDISIFTAMLGPRLKELV